MRQFIEMDMRACVGPPGSAYKVRITRPSPSPGPTTRYDIAAPNSGSTVLVPFAAQKSDDVDAGAAPLPFCFFSGVSTIDPTGSDGMLSLPRVPTWSSRAQASSMVMTMPLAQASSSLPSVKDGHGPLEKLI